MKILDGCYAFSKILSSDLLTKSPFLFKHRINLSLCAVLKDKVKIIIVLVVIVKLQNVTVIKLIHYFDFQFYLFNQIVFQDLLLIDNLDCVNILGNFMTHLVNLSKTTNTNIAISE